MGHVLPTACPVPPSAPASAARSPSAEPREGPPAWLDVPDRTRQAASVAFDLRDWTAQVADLACEVLPEDGWPHRLHRLCFTADGVHVVIDVVPSGASLRLLVGVSPPSVVRLEVRHGGPGRVRRTDPDGRGVVEPVSPGLVSVLLRSATRSTATAWARL